MSRTEHAGLPYCWTSFLYTPFFFLTRLDNIASTKRLIPFSDWQEGEQEIWKLQKRNPFTKSGMFGFLQN